MNAKQLIKNCYIDNKRVKVYPIELLDEKYVCHIGSEKTKFSQTKCVLQVIERISSMKEMYKNREGWDLEYTKLM